NFRRLAVSQREARRPISEAQRAPRKLAGAAGHAPHKRSARYYFFGMPDTTSPSSSPLRPALATLAAAPTTTTVRRLWKALSPEEKALGISASLNDDENGWVKKHTPRAAGAAL